MTPAEAIEAAELGEAEIRYRNQVGRLMYEAGRREARPRWPLSGPASPQWSAVRISPSSKERRWGPGGRAHFADPRPGDFPGRAARSKSRNPSWRHAYDDERPLSR